MKWTKGFGRFLGHFLVLMITTWLMRTSSLTVPRLSHLKCEVPETGDHDDAFGRLLDDYHHCREDLSNGLHLNTWFYNTTNFTFCFLHCFGEVGVPTRLWMALDFSSFFFRTLKIPDSWVFVGLLCDGISWWVCYDKTNVLCALESRLFYGAYFRLSVVLFFIHYIVLERRIYTFVEFQLGVPGG